MNPHPAAQHFRSIPSISAKLRALAAFRHVMLASACFSMALPASAAIVETFDQAGSGMANTAFSKVIASGGGTFERQALSTALAAPNTTPAIPINSGGDLEVRYYEASFAGSHSWAMTTTSYGDTVIDGYLGHGSVVPFGPPTGGFGLGLSGNTLSTVNGYVASVDVLPGPTRTIYILRVVNGVANGIVTSSPFSGFDGASENYHLYFSAIGTTLSASISRVQVVGGTVTETPIDLSGAPGVQTSITTSVAKPATGAAGLHAFARGQQSIFFDDVRVVPEPSSGILLCASGTALAGLIRKRRRVLHSGLGEVIAASGSGARGAGGGI